MVVEQNGSAIGHLRISFGSQRERARLLIRSRENDRLITPASQTSLKLEHNVPHRIVQAKHADQLVNGVGVR